MAAEGAVDVVDAAGRKRTLCAVLQLCTNHQTCSSKEMKELCDININTSHQLVVVPTPQKEKRARDITINISSLNN